MASKHMELQKFEVALDAAYARVWDEHNETDRPTHVYHYTSAEGLCGILTKCNFFASDLFCLNDPLEFQHGKSVVLDVLRAKSDPVSVALVENFESEPLFPHIGKNWSVYSVSFCGTKDLLGQWRGYGGPSGYAIGLSLEKVLSHASHRFAVIKVLYDLGKQHEVVEAFLAKALDSFEQAKKVADPDELLTSLGTRLIQFMFNMKQPAFRGEDEWRIILLEPHDTTAFELKYRASNGNIIPYIEFPFETGWISTIVSGPTVAPDANGWAIQSLLASHGFDDATWEHSAIHLRA
jgi:hypothetical protein